MIVKLITKKDSNIVLGYTLSPIEEKDIVFDLNLEDIFIGYSYIDENGAFISNKAEYEKAILNQELEAKKADLRAKRKPILVGLNTYKLNVNYGTIQETLEERELIDEWYKQLLDINQTEKAIENIPERVAYYCEEQHNDR